MSPDPGMAEPYILSGYDPVLAAVVVCFMSSRILQRAVNGIIGDVTNGFQRLRQGSDRSEN